MKNRVSLSLTPTNPATTPFRRGRAKTYPLPESGIITLIDELLKAGIRLIILNQNLILDQAQDDLQSLTRVTMLALFAQMERMMISRRTKEALATKKLQGIALGKPKGTRQKSCYDPDCERIAELLRLGVSARRIAIYHLGYGSISSLNYYIKTRKLLAPIWHDHTDPLIPAKSPLA